MTIKKLIPSWDGIKVVTSHVQTIKTKRATIKGLAHGTPKGPNTPDCLKRHIEVANVDAKYLEGHYRLYRLMTRRGVPFKVDGSDCYELKKIKKSEIKQRHIDRKVLLCVSPIIGKYGEVGELTIDPRYTELIYATKEKVNGGAVDAPMLILHGGGVNLTITMKDRIYYVKVVDYDVYVSIRYL